VSQLTLSFVEQQTQEQTMTTNILWLSPTDFVSGDKSLKISCPAVTPPAVEIKATDRGNPKWLYLGLRVPPDHEIHAMHVCYQLSNRRSFISQVQLVEMQTPDQTVVRHDDGTDLLSTTPTCYRSPVTPFRPGGAFLLALRLNFGHVADTITLVAIGVEVLSVGVAPTRNGEVNVLDFGADPTGVADSACAFMAAIASFGPPNDPFAGTVVVPFGAFRFANPVRIKKSVLIRGSQSASPSLSTVIVPDAGIEAFVFERYNTPTGASSAGAGDGAQIQNLVVKPAAKVRDWQRDHPYKVGDKVRSGTGVGEDWRRHYICTTKGISASSGSGPRSLGNDKLLNYDRQAVNFIVGQYVSGQTSGAAGIIIADSDSVAMGQLRLTSVSGVFQDNENLLNDVVYAVADGPSTTVGADTILKYDGQAVNFIVGQYVTGQTSKAAGLIVADSDSGATGQLRLTDVSGAFKNDEYLKVVCAVANGPSTAAEDDEIDNDARWRYLGCGAGIKIRANGCTLRDVTVYSASGNGIHIEAQDPEAPGAVANANSWHLDNVQIWDCDGHGLYLNGSDANGGSFIHGVMYANGSPTSDEDFTGQGYNIYDSSFLGNTYVAIQMGSGGQGSIHCDSVGGGSTFIGCYQEGTGGGENFVSGACVIVGGGLSASIFERGAVPVTLGPVGRSRGQGHAVVGYTGAPWRKNVAVKLGNRRVSGSRLYQVTKAGTTIDVEAGGPTGTGADIIDGSAHWSFVHDFTYDGYIAFGSVDPLYKVFFIMQAPDDVITGLPTYYRYDNFGGCNDVQGFQYGISGAGGDSGPGLMHAANKSQLNEWPMHIPAGRALFEMLWIGGRRITASTNRSAPTAGTWNPGDRVYFKGAAVMAGGAEGLECVTHGTAGTYAGGRTATADGSRTVLISGAAMSTLFDQHDFKVGDKLTINGVSARVESASNDGRTLMMANAVPPGSNLAITFAAPTFQEFGRIAGGAGDSTGTPDKPPLNTQEMNTQKGRSAIPLGAAAVTIKNDKVTPSSIIHATLQTVDITLKQLLTVVPGIGSFVITGNANATADVTVCWSIEE